ncbi:gamma-glutamylcyclotransferase family protein [Roseinatronobacter monicus]|nr:gamma-glutamylcyclotransferase family protein [Roseinatronobacter monicus]
MPRIWRHAHDLEVQYLNHSDWSFSDFALCARSWLQHLWRTHLMTFHYFAYGSNMLPARFINRCRSAKLIGTGIARDFRLDFTKQSKDGSGKAALRAAPGAHVPGVIFEVDLAERSTLDQHEGFGYRREDAFVVEDSVPGSTRMTNTYLATLSDPQVKPFDWYLATVIAGAMFHKMDDAHVAALRGIAFIEDTDKERKTRAAAIAAMHAHGIDDYRTLLEWPR